MNFYAHACLAADADPSPLHVMGAMVPDFTPALGLNLQILSEEGPDDLAAGIDHHRRVDRAFHAHRHFLALTERWRDRLHTELGLRRGVARAVAHVGIELLLDGWLVGDGTPRPAFRTGLEAGREYFAGRYPALGDAFARLLTSPLPGAYSDPEVAADRIRRILSRRPRLALAPEIQPELSDRLRSLQRELQEFAPELVADSAAGRRQP